MDNRKRREKIPEELADRVLFLSDRTCCVCRVRGKRLHIHHIDEDPSNNTAHNLAVLCTDCHADTMARGGFDRKLNANQIRLFRDDWLNQIGRLAAATPKSAGVRLEVSFCLEESAEWDGGRRIAARLINSGDIDVHIRQVALSFTAECAPEEPCHFRLEWTPRTADPTDGLIIPQRPINAHDRDPLWRRCYYLHWDDPRGSAYMLGAAANADIASLVFEVWADEYPDRPVWSGAREALGSLSFLIQKRWEGVWLNHPATRVLKDVLDLPGSATFRTWAELCELAKHSGYKDTTEGDQSAFWLSAFRKIGGPQHVRIHGSVFDEKAELRPMLPEEWQPDLVQVVPDECVRGRMHQEADEDGADW